MQNELKQAAGYRAAEWITSGMTIGLGSGSTARYATLRIGQRLGDGSLKDVVAVPTSEDTASLARSVGIPLTTLEQVTSIDVTIDGADEVDPQLNVIKGLGGALLREKIVAAATKREIIVVDQSKLSDRLGIKSPVPVEVIRFGWVQAQEALHETGARIEMRMAGDSPFVTDEGNYILDCWYSGIDQPTDLAATMNAIPAVVENGLFLGMVSDVVVASESGVITMTR